MKNTINSHQSRSSGLAVGLGLNIEIHGAGYGNIQCLSSYSDGQRTVNIGFTNDTTLAMQEQRHVPFFRMQPSINYDIAL